MVTDGRGNLLLVMYDGERVTVFDVGGILKRRCLLMMKSDLSILFRYRGERRSCCGLLLLVVDLLLSTTGRCGGQRLKSELIENNEWPMLAAPRCSPMSIEFRQLLGGMRPTLDEPKIERANYGEFRTGGGFFCAQLCANAAPFHFSPRPSHSHKQPPQPTVNASLFRPIHFNSSVASLVILSLSSFHNNFILHI